MTEQPDFHVRDLQHDADKRSTLKEADVILGMDPHTGGQQVFFGRDLLHLISDSGFTSGVGVVRVELDSSTDQLEYLVAAVQVLKGSCDLTEEGAS